MLTCSLTGTTSGVMHSNASACDPANYMYVRNITRSAYAQGLKLPALACQLHVDLESEEQTDSCSFDSSDPIEAYITMYCCMTAPTLYMLTGIRFDIAVGQVPSQPCSRTSLRYNPKDA